MGLVPSLGKSHQSSVIDFYFQTIFHNHTLELWVKFQQLKAVFGFSVFAHYTFGYTEVCLKQIFLFSITGFSNFVKVKEEKVLWHTEMWHLVIIWFFKKIVVPNWWSWNQRILVAYFIPKQFLNNNYIIRNKIRCLFLSFWIPGIKRNWKQFSYYTSWSIKKKKKNPACSIRLQRGIWHFA